MDAFSVSMANGLNEPKMKTSKAAGIAAVFAFFQIVMPLLGWFCVHTIASVFEAFRPAIPWIALVLLAFIGGKMLLEGLRNKGEAEKTAVGVGALLLQVWRLPSMLFPSASPFLIFPFRWRLRNVLS